MIRNKNKLGGNRQPEKITADLCEEINKHLKGTKGSELQELKDKIYQTIDNLKADGCHAGYIEEIQKLIPIKPKVVCNVTDKQIEDIKRLSYKPVIASVIQLRALFKILGVNYE